MPPRRLLALVFGAGAYALVSHWLMVQHTLAPWAVLLLLAPLLLGTAGLAAARFGRAGWALLPLMGAAAVYLALHDDGGDVPNLYLLQHVGIHLLLAAWFGGTLRAGRTPLISGLAAHIHNGLSPDMARYTRRVTQVWTGYFIGMAVVSAILYYGVAFEAWAFFDNVLTPLFMGLLFLGEHVVRYWLHPEFERVSIAVVIQAFRRARMGARP